MAITINGSGTIAGISAGGLPLGAGGKTAQVLQAVKTDTFSTSSSSSFVDITGLSVNITPGSASSKILILTQIAAFNDTTATSMYYSLYRATTNLAGASGFVRTYNGGSNLGSSVAMNFLDAPSTTDAREYSVYVKVNSGIGSISVNGATSTITALEIAG